jgi:hypothetical protein
MPLHNVDLFDSVFKKSSSDSFESNIDTLNVTKNQFVSNASKLNTCLFCQKTLFIKCTILGIKDHINSV